MFLEGDLPVSEMVVMMQKEVAERIAAQPGGKTYGALSVAVQYRCEVQQVCKVAPSAFMPSPDVESVVLKLTFHTEKPDMAKDEAVLFQAVRGAFAQRRKTLHNTIGNVFPTLKPELDELMLAIGITPSRRGETLSIKEFVALADELYLRSKNPK
jgi:16S rRNA (adenine1518-N6/adenine1519-N6)-dimethyltransferase